MAYTTINKSSLHFTPKIFTGTGSSQSITGLGFQPDWCWFKNRGVAESNNLYDVVRGPTYRIYSDSNAAQSNSGSSSRFVSFDSDGFTVGGDGMTNGSSASMVAWNWKANGAGSANTAGTINSTVSVNTTSGFSIVKYDGASGATGTVGHGLGVVPKMILVKRLDSADAWNVYHASLGNEKFLELNTTAAIQDSDNRWYDTTPTNTLFTVGDNDTVNGSGKSYIAYCFAEKTGYSKMGEFNGNNSDDGPFIYCGFKPKYVMVKNTHDATNWSITDDFRDGYNTAGNKILYANTSGVEDSSYAPIDHLSNGFKIRLNTEGYNGNGGQYIYMAIGQSLVGSNNVPCTAR
jgi:hypothetical protein